MRAPIPPSSPVRRLLAGLLTLALAGCTGAGILPSTVEEPATPDPAAAAAEALYDPGHVVEIEISMDPDDAATLSVETNNIFNLLEGADCMEEPWSGPFHWYPADVTVDGVLVEEVGIRKKGLIGSLSETKPSVKLKFDKYVAGQLLDGLERLTLNNSISDPALVRQCLGYQLFAAAGVPAPRCNFAHVTAQGIDLGIYVNVEPLKKDFLRYAFDGDDEGDLYEGTLSDFRPGWDRTFEVETSATDPSLAPILAVTEALQRTDDADALADLGAVLDRAAFDRFWAMEALVAHIDGYAGNRNNFYVYRPSDSDRLEFLPWGIDAIFRGPGDAPLTFANSALPNRLWNDPGGRARYLDALDALLDEVWDEDALLAEIDRMTALIEPYALDDPRRADETTALRGFIAQRRGFLEAALAQPLEDLPPPPPGSPCLVEAGSLRVEFATTWDTLGIEDPLNEGWSHLTGTYLGDTLDLEGGAVVGLDNGRVVLASLGLQTPSLVREVVAVVPTWMIDGDPIPLGGFGAQAYLIDIDFSSGEGEQQILGSLWQAWLEFDALEGVPGAAASGVIEGPLYYGGP